MSLPDEQVHLPLFDEEESVLVHRAFAAVTPRAPDDARLLRGLMERLSSLHGVLGEARKLRSATSLAGEVRNEETLTDHLCHIDGLVGDLVLPMKATLSRTYLIAKIMFFRGFVKTTTSLATAGEEFPQLSYLLREELAQSIYTLLAEELLLALLRKRDVPAHTKREAADQLITIWDDAETEIDDFCPLLEAAWHARNRITSGLGSLLGITEYFRLVTEDCPPQFLDFFARDEVSLAETQAFEEFLFNMTFEELTALRAEMKRCSMDTVTEAVACQVIGRPIDGLDQSGEIDPMALYRSYYRRQLAADYRNLSGGEGPRRTAEAYLMIYLLDEQAGVEYASDE